MTDNFAETYYLLIKQIVEKCIFFKNLDKFFGKIVKTEWVTGKEIDEQREV